MPLLQECKERKVQKTRSDSEAVYQERMSEISNRRCKAEVDSHISQTSEVAYTARTEQYKISRMFNTQTGRVYSNF